jgi:rubrerythrin
MEAWDLSKFEIEDVFLMAVAVEQGGYDFYQKIIDQTDNPRVKNEMKFLRDEEEKHKAFFAKSLEKKRSSSFSRDPSKKMSPAVKALLENEFLAPMQEMYRSKKIAKTDEALRFGMQLEQKTIDLYGGLKRMQGDPAFLADLETVIEEEKRHKATLNLILAY